jgi:hypothetical protein
LSEALRVDEPVEQATTALQPALQQEVGEDIAAPIPDTISRTPGLGAQIAPGEERLDGVDTQWEQPVGDIFNDDFGTTDFPASQFGGPDMSGLAAKAGAEFEAVAEADGFDPFAIDDGAPIPKIQSKAQQLGDELSLLEGSIAEMEANFAEPIPSFEPELGDPFGATMLPESFDAAEWVDADDASHIESEEFVLEVSEVAETDYQDHVMVSPEAESETMDALGDELGDHSSALAGEGDDLDGELGHEAWAAEMGAMGFSAEDEAERAREAAGTTGGVHRLHLADAEHYAPAHNPRRTTYEHIRDEASLEPEDALGRGDMPSVLNGFDEDELRDLVRNMIREELQGVMGERITRNVRKLVRREIQRALAADEFE